jgi:ABC-2 type transport system permease protein
MTTAAALALAKRPKSAFRRLLESESKLAWRFPIGLVLGVAAPVLLIVVFGSIPGMNHAEKRFGGLTYFNVYFPILIAFSVAILSLISLPTHLASYREQGILRRMATTPVPPTWMLAAQLLINLVLAAVALGVLVTIGILAFGLAAPKDPAGFALALVLTVAALFAIGLWISAFARSAAAAGGVGQLILYPSLFFAGVWVPQQVMASWLLDIAKWTPTGAAVHALQSAMHGTFPPTQSLLVLFAYTVVFGVLSVRFFRWE